MDASAELLATDFPEWRIEHSGAGTSYYSAHQGEGDEARHLGSPSAAGLRRLLEADQAGATISAMGAGLAEAGF